MQVLNKWFVILLAASFMWTSAMAQKTGPSVKDTQFPANYQLNSRDAGYVEDFSGDFPPAMWQNVIVAGDDQWEQFEGTDYYAAEYGGFSGDDDAAEMISPRFDLTASDSDMLSFIYVNEEWFGDQNVLEVYLSTNGGTDWTLLETYDYDTGDTFESVEIDLEGYDQTDNAHIKFKGINYFGYAIQVTDVQMPVLYYQAPVNVAASPASSSSLN